MHPLRPDPLHITHVNAPRRQAVYEKEPDAVKATPELVRPRPHWGPQVANPALVPHQLRQNLFSETPYAHTLLAFRGTPDAPGHPIGLALYFFNFSTWTGRPGLYVRSRRTFCVRPSADGLPRQLEDLFVKPECRGTGVGKALFAELAAIAQQRVRPPIPPSSSPLISPRASPSRTARAWTGPSSR